MYERRGEGRRVEVIIDGGGVHALTPQPGQGPAFCLHSFLSASPTLYFSSVCAPHFHPSSSWTQCLCGHLTSSIPAALHPLKHQYENLRVEPQSRTSENRLLFVPVMKSGTNSLDVMDSSIFQVVGSLDQPPSHDPVSVLSCGRSRPPP